MHSAAHNGAGLGTKSATRLAAKPAGVSEAEGAFQAALALAQTQTALAWEPRAAISLARLQFRQARIEAARATLSTVHARFSEGFDTADLVAAQALIGVFPPQP